MRLRLRVVDAQQQPQPRWGGAPLLIAWTERAGAGAGGAAPPGSLRRRSGGKRRLPITATATATATAAAPHRLLSSVASPSLCAVAPRPADEDRYCPTPRPHPPLLCLLLLSLTREPSPTPRNDCALVPHLLNLPPPPPFLILVQGRLIHNPTPASSTSAPTPSTSLTTPAGLPPTAPSSLPLAFLLSSSLRLRCRVVAPE